MQSPFSFPDKSLHSSGRYCNSSSFSISSLSKFSLHLTLSLNTSKFPHFRPELSSSFCVFSTITSFFLHFQQELYSSNPSALTGHFPILSLHTLSPSHKNCHCPNPQKP